MAEQFLDRPNVVAVFQQVRGAGVADGVATGRFRDACCAYRRFDRFLQRAFMNMVPPHHTRTRLRRQLIGGKHILPTPFTIRVRILAGQRIRQLDAAIALFEIILMERPRTAQLPLEGFADTVGQKRGPVLVAFAAAHHHLALGKIHILDPQPQALH
jgi:hypothetical protein